MPSVCIVYPSDPLGHLPGGIETFIDGLIRWAPDDVEMRLVGITTDPLNRRVGMWNRCSLGKRRFDFFPLFAFERSARRPKVPVTLRFLVALLRARLKIDADLLEFHRPEPVLPFLFDSRPKTCFIHQNMAALRNESSDIRWKYAPSLYFALEGMVIRRLRKLFCVRQDAVVAYGNRYPEYRERFAFTPTWVDPTQFSPVEPARRVELRRKLTQSVGITSEHAVLLSVGRLDAQKDPLLLLRAFELVHKRRRAGLIFVGDGELRPDVERFIQERGLDAAVKTVGLKPKVEIADWLRAADAFVLSSAYEGMPMAVLEALGSGLPVVSTDVGEVRLVVKPGVNGELVTSREAENLAAGIERCLDHHDRYAGTPCTSAVLDYSPQRVVSDIYRIYRGFLQ